MQILIKNCKTTLHLLGMKAIKDNNADELVEVEVLIENNMIKDVSLLPETISQEVGNIDETIDGGGAFLSPGLCDPQVHFREPGLEYKEDILSGSLAAAKGGFTTVISMPNTTPTADNKETVQLMLKKSQDVGVCRVLPTGAVSIGLRGKELPDFKSMKEAGAIAFTDDGKGVQDDAIFLAAMVEAKKLDMPVLDHSEDESLSLGGAIHKGEVSKKYNIKGIDSLSEAAHVERGCVQSEQTGCHYHVLHVSTKKSIEFVRLAKRKGLNVTVEVSPHHLILCDEDIVERCTNDLDPNWKMNPPLRSKQDRAACVEALIDGTIDAIATDHAPHAPYEKKLHIENAPFGIIGLETAFPLIYTKFVANGLLSLNSCIDLMSKKAAALFGLEMGRIQVGTRADLTLLDLETIFEVDESFFASKSKNSPFIGQKLKGASLWTMFQGEIVYQKNK